MTASPQEIAETLALRGFEVASIEPAPDRRAAAMAAVGRRRQPTDAVIDFEVTANRPDCLSVLGFAREIATAYDLPLSAAALSARPRRRLAASAAESGAGTSGGSRRRGAVPALRRGARRGPRRRDRRSG